MEIWKSITGFETKYLVSDLGRVKSLSRDYKYGSHDDVILKTNDRRGYEGVTLFDNGKRYYKAVHRLVAEAFIPNPDNKPCINHKDENRKNNRANNLEWCTYSENSNYGNCRKKISNRVSRRVYQLSKDGEIIKVWDSMSKASESLGVHLSEISKCCKNHKFTAGGFRWRKEDI
jgi:hypothetical protein